MSQRSTPGTRRFRLGSAGAVGAVAAIALMFTLIGVMGGFDKTSGGEVGVVRNGGWFSDNQIRKVIPPGSGLTWIGFFSTTHRYPAQQRYYTITADPQRGGRPGVDVVHTPSNDGVEMGIEATIYFTVNIAPDAIMSFDDKFGTRPFLGADGQLHYAWDGVDGWNAFFDAVARPIIENDLRIQINNFRCTELVSSCALVQNGSLAAAKAPTPAAVASTTGQQNNSNIARVQQSQARVLQAQADADANKKRQEGYNACPTCAQIDMIKALPPGITTYAPGAGSAVPVK